MAANLTPQYLKAEEQYRRAATTEEELRALEIMLREMPKHKSSEKLQADLKHKISRARHELEAERKQGRKSHAVRILRQGAGTGILLGGPNAGKSSLLRALTRATPEVAPYPFTTRTPLPGMMPWQDVNVQLVDTPPITADVLEPYLLNLVRAADLAILVIDLGNDDGIEACQAVLDRLAATKTRLARDSSLDPDDVGLSYTRTLVVPNKIDLPDAAVRLELLHELLPLDFPEWVISAKQGTGVEALRGAIFAALDVMRVYTKLPTHKEPDMERPFTVRQGSTVLDVAEQVHKDFVEKFKFARVWGTRVHPGTVVKADHVVADRDIVELHM